MQNKKLTISLVASFFLATNLLSNELFISSATKSEQSIKDVTSNVEVITKEDIEEKHFTNISEALNSVLGFSFTNNGGLGKTTSVYLRGFDSKRVLVLIDGVRYTDHTSANGTPFENIILANVERIEVIKGAQSGIWGADASAGVINIITKKATEGFSGNANVEFGNFNTSKMGLNLNYSEKKYYVQASVNKIDTDGFSAYSKRYTDIDNYEDDGFENNQYTLKTGLNINENNSVDLSHTQTNSTTEFDSSGLDVVGNYSKAKNDFTSINYENINTLGKVDLYYNKSSFYRNYPVYSSIYEGTIDEAGVKSTIDYLNNSSFVVFGADYKDFNQKDVINKDYKNRALYVTNSNKFDKTIVTQSLRYDAYDKFDNKTTGKLGLKHNYNDDTFTSANIGTAYNIPKLSELYGRFGANPDLNPETTKSLDLSFGYKSVQVTYFHNKIDNMIEWNGSGYDNLSGTSVLKGYEVSYKKDIFKDTYLGLNYTHLSAQNSDNQDLARRPKDQIDMSFDYYGIKKTHINLNGSYVGTRYNGKDKTGTQTGRYTVWNSVVNYDINKNLKTYLKIDNLFDKYYQTVDGYSTSPRAFYVGLKATF